eukprot:CAMPEP_0185752492 /NCGR_PEP_ID=MMETSP1174-20130828/11285_1 /TAXON_ID=35687 /ORGANISM="Dictyocha speculum, Strain CCMP1381" /LENGTH=442 /DNA_ID=CAMNT_0028429967 /DNA_START=260 /DNA_END=1588 /DNA_ORIENTATION=-
MPTYRAHDRTRTGSRSRQRLVKADQSSQKNKHGFLPSPSRDGAGGLTHDSGSRTPMINTSRRDAPSSRHGHSSRGRSVPRESDASRASPVKEIKAVDTSGSRRTQRGRSSDRNKSAHYNLPMISNHEGNKGLELTTRGETSALAGAYSIQGRKPGHPNWSNQDNFLLMEKVQGESHRHTWIVFDGHGDRGHLVSKFGREKMGKTWIDNKFRLRETFLSMQQQLNKSSVDVRSSGSTCVMVVLDNDCLKVANCGDSRAVLGKVVNSSSQLATIVLTDDHKPDRPDERMRVEKAGGQVGCRQMLMNRGSSVRVPLGPARVWYTNRGETTGLAMSRSLGDAIVHTFGVSEEPEVTQRTLDKTERFIIVATDGIWDVLHSSHVVQIVDKHFNEAARSNSPWNPQDAAMVLCLTARRRWEGMSTMVDDITAVVIDLSALHAKKAQRH